MVPELDHVMATLLDDLEERGLLRNTLIVTLAEFGRTPAINSTVGRDHFASAWSTTLSGCGVRGGMAFGRSDASGNRVEEGEIGAARLFATIYRALGIPSDLFTPVFAVSRVAGWTAHVREQLQNNKLIRPEADYQGPRDVRYVPLEKR